MKVLLATNSPEIDGHIKGEAVYYREAVFDAALKSGANVVVLSAFLPGSADLASLVYRLRREDIRVVFLAGSLEKDDPLIQKLLQCGVYDIIFNPVFPARVQAVLQSPMTFGQVSAILDGASPAAGSGDEGEKGRRRTGTLACVWSPVPAGKTFVAVNLAAVAAASRRTALVDFTGAAHTWLNLPKGDCSLYSGEPSRTGPAIYTFDPDIESQAGSAPKPDLLASLVKKYDLVVVDGMFLQDADAFFLVADHDYHHARLIRRQLPACEFKLVSVKLL